MQANGVGGKMLTHPLAGARRHRRKDGGDGKTGQRDGQHIRDRGRIPGQQRRAQECPRQAALD